MDSHPHGLMRSDDVNEYVDSDSDSDAGSDASSDSSSESEDGRADEGAFFGDAEGDEFYASVALGIAMCPGMSLRDCTRRLGRDEVDPSHHVGWAVDVQSRTLIPQK